MRLGIITTGHGPRAEYVRYHQGLAAALGMRIEVLDEHILEALDWKAIEPHLGRVDELRLGAHVRVPGATGNRLGDGWEHVYVRMSWAIPYFQAAIDRLVKAGADVVLFCCATRFDDDAFRCRVPLVRPSTQTLSVVAEMTNARDGPLRLGLMSSVGHGRQDVRLWQEQPFAGRLLIDYEPFEGDILPAANALATKKLDVVVVWSYGLGIAGSDPESLSARLEAMFSCPVLMPHRVAAFSAFALMPAAFDDRRFAAGVASSTPG